MHPLTQEETQAAAPLTHEEAMAAFWAAHKYGLPLPLASKNTHIDTVADEVQTLTLIQASDGTDRSVAQYTTPSGALVLGSNFIGPWYVMADDALPLLALPGMAP